MENIPEINLTSDLAQKIVDRTMEILNYNINIRDYNGRIIASGNQKRIDTISEMAAQAIKEEEVLTVSKQKAEGDSGMEPGIQLPIYFNGKIMGAVDITGEPKRIEKYGGLVKMTVELMLQQAFYLKKLQLEEQAEEHFIKELLNKNSELSNANIQDRAQVMGYDQRRSYLVAILELTNLWDKLLENVGDTSSMKLQQYKIKIQEGIQELFYNQSSVKVFHLDGERFIILKCEANDDLKNKEDLLELGTNLVGKLDKRFNFDCKLGIGKINQGLRGIRKSFEEGLEALDLGIRFYPTKQVHYSGNLIQERIVENLAPEVRQDLAEIFPLDDQYQQSLEVYFASNLNVSKTANKLCLHRNSVMYRLNRITEITGFDPRDSEDMVNLKLALLCYKLESSN
ncbi:CdaR family transcriptional regulator [Acetohalobium arabaticum]|uniref:Transcriptional regulator, CdaR n=1 Tax=Acetohalobium arabaticum (strain ATCC 49924 / DSM 5501 / Z-7288) TaxID=574087 RepID=D9QPY3_ACEAZ|nr:sugar diacid recognition domain-containing protein [Acetohalobium arabaticum]ADL12574.1 transcriptional regulator, CdaR [Acetohalobium arabaticum DSM 5501]